MKADATQLVKAIREAADDPDCPFKGCRIEVQDREDGAVAVSVTWGKAEAAKGYAYVWASVLRPGEATTAREAYLRVRKMIQGILISSLIGGPGRVQSPGDLRR